MPGARFHAARGCDPIPTRVGGYRSACSVNHGSGRVLSRGDAKQGLSELHDDMDREIAEIRRTLAGVEVRQVVVIKARTPLDECGHV